jgi:hypothetical protein
MLVQIQNLDPAAKEPLIVKKQVSAGQPLQLKTQPGMRLELSIDGVKQTGKLQSPGVGQFKLKRVGANLLVVDGQEETLCELLEFFETPDVTLIGRDWTFVGGTPAELAEVVFTDLGLYSGAADVALAGAAPVVAGGGLGTVGGALGAAVGLGAAAGGGGSGSNGAAQAALAKIAAYADNSTSNPAPTAQDYLDIGVAGLGSTGQPTVAMINSALADTDITSALANTAAKV